MNKTTKLNKYIAVLKEQYPSFRYINVLSEQSAETQMITDDYAIIVKDIPKTKITEFLSYVDKYILDACIEEDAPLPSIILLQREDTVEDVTFVYWNAIAGSHDQLEQLICVENYAHLQDPNLFGSPWKQQLIRNNLYANSGALLSDIYDLAA